MVLEKTLSRMKYAGAVVAGAAALAGCGGRIAYQPMSSEKAVLLDVSSKEAKYGVRPAEVEVPETVAGLEKIARDYALKPEQRTANDVAGNFDFSAYSKFLGEDGVKTANILKQRAAEADRICYGLRGNLLETYTRMNAMTPDISEAMAKAAKKDLKSMEKVKYFRDGLEDKCRDAIDSASDEMKSFSKKTREGKDLTFNDVAKLKYRADKSGKPELIKAANESVNRFYDKSLALGAVQDAIDNLYLSEARNRGYGLKDNTDFVLKTEGLARSIDAEAVGRGVIEELGLKEFKAKKEAEFRAYEHRNKTFDGDNSHRGPGFEILSAITEAGARRKGRIEPDSIRFAQLVAIRDLAEIAEKADPQSGLVKFLRYDVAGTALLVGYHGYETYQYGTHSFGVANTALEAAKDPKDKTFAGTMSRVKRATTGYDNGNWLQGDADVSDMRIATGLKGVQTISEIALLLNWAGVFAKGSGGHGKGSSNSHHHHSDPTPDGPNPPGPHKGQGTAQ
jgi:hypothetical protein